MTEVCTLGETGFLTGCGQFSYCQLNQKSNQYECYHDSAFDMTPSLWVTYLIMPLFIGIGILGGLGGGILKGPFLEVILNYSQGVATHISYCLMFGSTSLNTILLLFERKPDEPERPIINFWIAVIFNLGIPLGTNLGASLISFLPQIYIIVFQEIFLIIVGPIIWKKGTEQKALEKKMKLLEHERSQQLSHLKKSKSTISKVCDVETIENEEVGIVDEKYQKFKKESEQLFPIVPIVFIFLSFGLNQIIIQMMSTATYQSYVGLKDCTVGNYSIILLLIAANVAFTYFVWNYGRRRELLQDTVNFMPNERYFTPISTFFKNYAGGFGAGFISGLLGMGAGLIMVPVMLSNGLIARCASATSAVNYFMISLNNLITLVTGHYLDWQIILLFTFLALIGGSVFAKIGYVLMDEYKIGYIVIFFVFSLDVANIISEIYYGVVTGERYGIQILTTADGSC